MTHGRDYLKVNDKTITFHTGNSDTGSIATNDLFDRSRRRATVGDLMAAIDTASGGTATRRRPPASFTLTTGTAANISLSRFAGSGR